MPRCCLYRPERSSSSGRASVSDSKSHKSRQPVIQSLENRVYGVMNKAVTMLFVVKTDVQSSIHVFALKSGEKSSKARGR